MVGHISTIGSSGMYNDKLVMGFMTLKRILMIPYEMLLRVDLNIIGFIDLIGSCSGGFDGYGDVL